MCIDSSPEIAACFGSDATVSALKWQIAVPIKKDIQAIRSARENGVDVKTITLSTFAGKGQTFTSQHFLHTVFAFHFLDASSYPPDITEWFGSDDTSVSIRFQFSTKVKKDVDALRAGQAQGLDAKDITLPSLAGKGAGKGPSSIYLLSACSLSLIKLWRFF